MCRLAPVTEDLEGVTLLGKLLIVVLLAMALLPTVDAQAATCADYSNQADAQRAQDTRDADGDGIYCESLPCRA